MAVDELYLNYLATLSPGTLKGEWAFHYTRCVELAAMDIIDALNPAWHELYTHHYARRVQCLERLRSRKIDGPHVKIEAEVGLPL